MMFADDYYDGDDTREERPRPLDLEETIRAVI
jgi:hypothetical protein